jgi:hypothetical protein
MVYNTISDEARLRDKTKCSLCGKKLRPFTGLNSFDWGKRILHKKCWKKTQNN